MIRFDFYSVRLPIALLAGSTIAVVDYLYDVGVFPEDPLLFIFGMFIAALACFIAYQRGGLHGPVFWFTLAGGYVILSPLFSFAFGYQYFSLLARKYQSIDAMSVPIFEGALAVLILAITMNALSVSAGGAAEKTLRLPFGPRTNTIGMLCTCFCILFFAWLAEPGPIIGVDTLQQWRDARFSDTHFAGGAWAMFSVLAVYLYLGLRRIKGVGAFVVRSLYFVSVGLSLLWLFLHSRRSETLGYVLFVYCVLSATKERKRAGSTSGLFRFPKLLETKLIALVFMVLLFAAIGYVRTTAAWQFEKADFVQSPGGAANDLLVYLSCFDIFHHSSFGIYPGQTYVNQIIDLPPQFMGLTQAPDAYYYLAQKINLIGGQYWLMEPMMNFGGAGIFVYALLISWLGSCSVKAVRRSLFENGSVHSFLQGGTFLALMFRTLWYGPAAATNGAIMVILSAGGIYFLSVIGKSVGVRRIINVAR